MPVIWTGLLWYCHRQARRKQATENQDAATLLHAEPTPIQARILLKRIALFSCGVVSVVGVISYLCYGKPNLTQLALYELTLPLAITSGAFLYGKALGVRLRD